MAQQTAHQVYRNKILKDSTVVPKAAVYLVDGAIDPAMDHVHLTKATAGAYTLAAPSLGSNGHRILITSLTAAAHVVTSTDSIHDGVTGGVKDLATFAAFRGATMELVAVDGLWHTVSLKAVTVTAA